MVIEKKYYDIAQRELEEMQREINAENPCAMCGGQQNDRPALAASHEEGAGRYGESQEKSPTPARQADAPAAYEAQHRRFQHRDHGSEYPGLFFHGEEVRPGFCFEEGHLRRAYPVPGILQGSGCRCDYGGLPGVLR